MNDIMSLAVVGAAISVALEFMKYFIEKYGDINNASMKIGAVIVLSLVAAVLYSVFKDTHYWQTFLQILVYANAVYAILIKQIVNWSKSV